MEHIPGYKNKATDCLSRLPLVTRKRNDNPLKDGISINMTQTEDNTQCCPLCIVDITDTKASQQDRLCTRIAKMMEDPKSRFNESDLYGYDSTGLLYHINYENGKEYKATIVPKVLIKTVLQDMHDHFGIGKTYSVIKRYYYWPKMIKHIKAHVDSSLCRKEKMQADKYQLQATEIPETTEYLLKCPLT